MKISFEFKEPKEFEDFEVDVVEGMKKSSYRYKTREAMQKDLQFAIGWFLRDTKDETFEEPVRSTKAKKGGV